MGRVPGIGAPAVTGRSRRGVAAAWPKPALFTTSPYLFSDEEAEAYRRVERAIRLARYGCDCYAYCMVGSGQADIVIEAGSEEL